MLGDKIKALRKEKKLTQDDLANILNVHKTNVSKWERNKYKPSIDILANIADYFQVSVDYLIDNEPAILLGEKLKDLRKTKGLTLKEVADNIGLGESTISLYENNNRRPDYVTLNKLSALYNVSIDYLLNNDSPNVNFGERIKALREQNNITQQELADMLNVDRTSVGKWETNQNLANNNILQKLCSIFNVSMDYLLGRADLPQSTEIAPDGEIENELLNICKKLSIEKKAKLLIYAYELVKKPYEQ